MTKIKMKQSIKKPLPANKSKGVGLVEVLVSILVLGVGALGIATMQLTGLKYNVGSQGRSQAILLANDMMDRLRANIELAKVSPTYSTVGITNNVDNAPPFNCYTARCTPDELAQFDKWHWLEQVETLLPFGSGGIATFDRGGEKFYEITLRWRQVAGRQNNANVTQDAADEIQSFTFQSTL